MHVIDGMVTVYPRHEFIPSLSHQQLFDTFVQSDCLVTIATFHDTCYGSFSDHSWLNTTIFKPESWNRLPIVEGKFSMVCNVIIRRTRLLKLSGCVYTNYVAFSYSAWPNTQTNVDNCSVSLIETDSFRTRFPVASLFKTVNSVPC